MERELEETIFSLPKAELDNVRGNPQLVIKLIEKHCPRARFLGRSKAKVIVEELRARNEDKFGEKSSQPLILVELGCYLGTSAIILTDLLINLPNHSSSLSKYYTFEIDPEFARIASRFIELAGLQDKIEIIVGAASKTLVEFSTRIKNVQPNTGCFIKVDFLLIDHKKDLYVDDLRIAESLNLIYPGTFIVADNVRFPGAPEYDRYVKSSPSAKRDFNMSHLNPAGSQFIGRWNLLYETKSIEVEMYTKWGEKLDIIDFTECIDYLNG